jgi:hypothetical protein
LKGGKLLIQKGVLGKANDDVNGTIKGQIDMLINDMGGRPSVSMGGYDIQLNINIKEKREKEVGIIMDFACGGLQKKVGNVTNYPCGLSGANFASPPKKRAL